MDWELADNKKNHNVGDYVRAYPPYESPAIICKVVKVTEKNGWYHHKIEPLNLLEKVKVRLLHPEIKEAFPSSFDSKQTPEKKQ